MNGDSVSSATPLVSGVSKPFSDIYTVPLVSSVALVCLTSIQYGFHMSELNAPEELIKGALDLDSSQIGLVTSIFSIGGLVSSTFAGQLSSRIGLRFSFVITALHYTLGSYVEYSAQTYLWMLLGRFVSGLGAGFALVLVPLYINEVSPVSLRGVLGSMNQVSINVGILLAQLLAINWSTETHWRSILGSGAFIAFVSLLSSVFLLEESPKWLILTAGDESKGLQILNRLRNHNTIQCTQEVQIWKEEKRKHASLIESNPSLQNLSFYTYLSNRNYSNSRIVATFAMVGQQFAGINSIVFYGVKILTGLFPAHAILVNCLISTGNMVITFIASLFLDRLGRKPMLLGSVAVMGLASIALSVGIIFQNSALTLLSVLTYVGSFAIGCGPIPFLLISEVSQLEIKDLAQSWATDCNWVSCFLVGFLFPVLNSWIGGYTFLLFAAVCAAFYVFIATFVPETKGKSTYAEVWETRGD
ncbi:hypothetical protein OGAPHI_001623 [Ogataea philodendri]|uniref:Major facilitator superfamily (MFS) profile domain-containing protein n=1 Tax=Ogataea philodendri TaxID=1378263 RepID=A0A9P8PCT6_9ASCO|nr:uncharacterized protein OGAPHI_001623 [Ogataea philodendri]KAH3669502.1 hypothetical protein OGAPHI_001623 [Ogataea philodendri]